jgi:hypothetical protein
MTTGREGPSLSSTALSTESEGVVFTGEDSIAFVDSAVCCAFCSLSQAAIAEATAKVPAYMNPITRYDFLIFILRKNPHNLCVDSVKPNCLLQKYLY